MPSAPTCVNQRSYTLTCLALMNRRTVLRAKKVLRSPRKRCIPIKVKARVVVIHAYIPYIYIIVANLVILFILTQVHTYCPTFTKTVLIWIFGPKFAATPLSVPLFFWFLEH